jgi:hypothetical protein
MLGYGGLEAHDDGFGGREDRVMLLGRGGGRGSPGRRDHCSKVR